VEASGEYDASEPQAARVAHLERAVAIFRRRFGRPPTSFCPPDYRWDTALDPELARWDLRVLQGLTGHGPWPGLARWLPLGPWPDLRQGRLYLPPHIAFEPRGDASPRARLGAARVHAMVRVAWRHGRPAIVSTHRLNYAHLDAAWSAAGRAALRDLLARLCGDGAVFLTDARLHALLLAREGIA